MPNSTTVCGDINLRGIVGIENHAMAPLEVVALDVFPMDAAIGGAVSSSVKTADIKYIGMLGIDGQVVNVLRLGVKSPPGLTAIVGGINTTVHIGGVTLLPPCRQVKPLRIARVDLQAGWAGNAGRD